jgi:DNA-binding CsgD family transcriptional regulator
MNSKIILSQDDSYKMYLTAGEPKSLNTRWSDVLEYSKNIRTTKPGIADQDNLNKIEVSNKHEEKTRQRRDKYAGVYLTDAQKEVLYYLLQDYSDDKIIKLMNISEKEINQHVCALIKKFKFNDRRRMIIELFNNKELRKYFAYNEEKKQ